MGEEFAAAMETTLYFTFVLLTQSKFEKAVNKEFPSTGVAILNQNYLVYTIMS